MNFDDLKKRADMVLDGSGFGSVSARASGLIRDLLFALDTARATALEEAAADLATCDLTVCAASESVCRPVARVCAARLRALTPRPPGVVVLTREEVERLEREADAANDFAHGLDGRGAIELRRATSSIRDSLTAALERKR